MHGHELDHCAGSRKRSWVLGRENTDGRWDAATPQGVSRRDRWVPLFTPEGPIFSVRQGGG